MPISSSLQSAQLAPGAPQNAPRRLPRWASAAAWVAVATVLAACATPPLPPSPPGPELSAPPAAPISLRPTPAPSGVVASADLLPTPAISPEHPTWRWADSQPLPAPLVRDNSVWQPVRFADLPGWGSDDSHPAWNAWLRSCERPAPVWVGLCTEVRRLSLASVSDQLEWMMRHLQPYRVQSAQGEATGLLTGYYEPLLPASRVRTSQHQVPLYRVPPSLRPGQPWFTREQMQTDAQALAQLQGLEIVWLADPLDALLLQIQGSGRILVSEPDGSQRLVRLAFAGHNGHPYQSVMRWLLQRQLIRAGTWEALRAWVAAHPQHIDDMLWSNPRTVFFREEALSALDQQFGPRGAQGVALTPGRSIAVDRRSIPYGTPVWMQSVGPVAQLRRLVLAQDTGSAIVGAVRGDYFTGWGDVAYQLAADMKQPLQMWAFWPRSAPPQ